MKLREVKKLFKDDDKYDPIVGLNCSDQFAVLTPTGCACRQNYFDIGVGCRPAQPFKILETLNIAIKVRFLFSIHARRMGRETSREEK